MNTSRVLPRTSAPLKRARTSEVLESNYWTFPTHLVSGVVRFAHCSSASSNLEFLNFSGTLATPRCSVFSTVALADSVKHTWFSDMGLDGVGENQMLELRLAQRHKRSKRCLSLSLFLIFSCFCCLIYVPFMSILCWLWYPWIRACFSENMGNKAFTFDVGVFCNNCSFCFWA